MNIGYNGTPSTYITRSVVDPYVSNSLSQMAQMAQTDDIDYAEILSNLAAGIVAPPREPEPTTAELVTKITELQRYRDETVPDVIATLYEKILETQPVWDSVVDVAPTLIVYDADHRSTFYMRKLVDCSLEFSNSKAFSSEMPSLIAAISIVSTITATIAYMISLVLHIGIWLPATVVVLVATLFVMMAKSEFRTKKSSISLEDIAFGNIALSESARIELLSLILTWLERKIKQYHTQLENGVTDYKDYLRLTDKPEPSGYLDII